MFDENIKKLGLTIPNPPDAVANYIPYKIADKILYISGQAPLKDGNVIYKGKVGDNISMEEGIKAAELCCINIIAALKKSINNDWDQLDTFIKLGGFVNCKEDFVDQPKIINGASEIIAKVFDSKGLHTRAAISSNSLPLGVAVEVDAVFEIK